MWSCTVFVTIIIQSPLLSTSLIICKRYIYFLFLFSVGRIFGLCHTNTLVIPSIQYAVVVLVVLPSFALEEQHGKLARTPVTAEEVVAWEVVKILTVNFGEHNTNTNGVCERKHEQQKWATGGTYMCYFL